jgi:hypothetical protein
VLQIIRFHLSKISLWQLSSTEILDVSATHWNSTFLDVMALAALMNRIYYEKGNLVGELLAPRAVIWYFSEPSTKRIYSNSHFERGYKFAGAVLILNFLPRR